MDIKNRIVKKRDFCEFDVKRNSLINRYGLLLCVPTELLKDATHGLFFWYTLAEAESSDILQDLRAVLHNIENKIFRGLFLTYL